MSCESKSWRPAHWTVTKRRLFEYHLYKRFDLEVNELLGPYEGAKLAAQVRAQMRAAESLARLRNAGVRTLGEVGS